MEERQKKVVPSFLLGQLIATIQLIEEDVIEHDNPSDNTITVAETYFNDMIEEPETTLKRIEEKLLPNGERLSHFQEKRLGNDMKLILKIKQQYRMTDEHLDEDEFFKGYYQQLKKYYT